MTDEPIAKAKKYVALKINQDRLSAGHEAVTIEDDILVVWFCYILGGWKCLVIDNSDFGMIGGHYYEVTYNRDRMETYIDTYVKQSNVCIPHATISQPTSE